MRRPSRSFTVEVKRSRMRTGESSIANAFSEREELPAASVASSLSWDELLRRLPENVASQSDQPFISSWPGFDEAFQAKTQPQPQLQPEPEPEPQPSAEAATAFEREPQDDIKKPRVLPSLLPVEVPLTERKSAVYEEDAPGWPATRSRAPHSRLTRQSSLAQTSELRAAVTQDKPRRAFIGQGTKVTVEELKKLVETHLQDRTVETVRSPVKPVQTTALASAKATRTIEVNVTREGAARGAVKRRRQDFWKHRLRSYAAK